MLKALLYSNSARACVLAKATLHRRDGSTICYANAMNATSGTGCAWTPAVRRLNVLYFDAERRCIFPRMQCTPSPADANELGDKACNSQNVRTDAISQWVHTLWRLPSTHRPRSLGNKACHQSSCSRPKCKKPNFWPALRNWANATGAGRRDRPYQEHQSITVP